MPNFDTWGANGFSQRCTNPTTEIVAASFKCSSHQVKRLHMVHKHINIQLQNDLGFSSSIYLAYQATTCHNFQSSSLDKCPCPMGSRATFQAIALAMYLNPDIYYCMCMYISYSLYMFSYIFTGNVFFDGILSWEIWASGLLWLQKRYSTAQISLRPSSCTSWSAWTGK